MQYLLPQFCFCPYRAYSCKTLFTQGDALGYVLVAPAGRIAHDYGGSHFFTSYYAVLIYS